MFKYVLSAFICLVFAMPAAAQCGCEAAPTCRTPKTLGFIPVKRSLPQISMKCVTDACGCSRRKLSIDCVEVTGARLGLVDKKPCSGGFLKGLFSCNKGCGCAAPAPEPCGCEAAPEPAPCGCGGAVAEPIMYADPVAAPAPVADCGCNG
jgi:hypothetical protein